MKFKLFCKQYMMVCIVSHAAIQSTVAIVPLLCIVLYVRQLFFLRLLCLFVYIYIV